MVGKLEGIDSMGNYIFSEREKEELLRQLNAASLLFPQFGLSEEDNRLVLLGQGGFSSVYEMYSTKHPEQKYALKVMGFEENNISSEEFENTTDIQWIMKKNCPYIVRIIASRQLWFEVNEEGTIIDVFGEDQQNYWKNGFILRFILMDKEQKIFEKDRFGKGGLKREELASEKEVVELGLQIGNALLKMHNMDCIHRDIKLENIFWDEEECIYELGDFGISKMAENGEAETIAYTDGYGAPEVRSLVIDKYDARADMYSFGVSLYLLLNDLKFPGSSGYYPRKEIQYDPEVIWPAPAHASEGLTRIIRKMCSYYSENRYNNMAEALEELYLYAENENIRVDEGLVEAIEEDTLTFNSKMLEAGETKIQKLFHGPERFSKAEVKLIKKENMKVLGFYNVIYVIILTTLITVWFTGIVTEKKPFETIFFLLLPFMLMGQAVFLKIRDFSKVFGLIILALIGLSIYDSGFTPQHLTMIIVMLIRFSNLDIAVGLGTIFWMIIERTGVFPFLDIIKKYNLSWIVLVLIIVVIGIHIYHILTVAKELNDFEEGNKKQ